MLVPQVAVQDLQGAKTVLVVGEDDKVVLRTVTLREPYEQYYIVASGLKPGEELKAKLHRGGRAAPKANLELAVGRILELAVSLDELKINPGDPIEMYVEAFAKRQSIERVPHEGSIRLTVPSPDFEYIMWQV